MTVAQCNPDCRDKFCRSIPRENVSTPKASGGRQAIASGSVAEWAIRSKETRRPMRQDIRKCKQWAVPETAHNRIGARLTAASLGGGWAMQRSFDWFGPYFFPLSSSSTLRLSVTEKTPGTLLACVSAICLSICRATTPSRVTCPFFTMM